MRKRFLYLCATAFIVLVLPANAVNRGGFDRALATGSGSGLNRHHSVAEPSVLTVLFSGLGLVSTIRRFRD